MSRSVIFSVLLLVCAVDAVAQPPDVVLLDGKIVTVDAR